MRNIYGVLDVETGNTLGWPLVYDVAINIVDKQGNSFFKQNWIIEEMFTNPDIMCNAYYARKYFTHYPYILLNNPNVKMCPWDQFKRELVAAMEQHGVNIFCAYNAAFDIRAMSLTEFTFLHDIKSKQVLTERIKKSDPETAELLRQPSHFIDYDQYKILDIYRFAAQTFMQSSRFRQTALEQLWLTPNGNYSTTAQVAHRYLTGEHEFIESHTALEDVEIETDILLRCINARRGKIPYNLLDPACIVSRLAQPQEGMYFHERNNITFSNFIRDQFAVAYGMDYETFRHLNYVEQWQMILDPGYEIVPSQLDKTQRKELADLFKHKVGVAWKQWIKLEDNFKILRLVDMAGINWYIPDDEIQPELPPNLTRKYMEEKAVLDGKLKSKPVFKQDMIELTAETML